jgi:SAM-dependent methyltransferase
LPRNNFDVVVSVMVFRYMPDKFRALKNLVDSLNTGGTLAIVDFGDIRIDGEQCDLNRRRDRELFMKIVGEKNPWLDITVTETGGILIKKTRKNESRFDLRFEGSEPCYPDLFSGALELGKMRSSSALLSRYSSR